jgi:hypothetical protein
MAEIWGILKGFAMNKRIIVALVAFIVTFGLSAGLVGLLFPSTFTETYSFSIASEHKEDILNLLDQDIYNGQLRSEAYARARQDNWEDNNLVHYAESVNDYVDASSSLDDSDLPRDFQSAWQQHLSAWRDYSDFLNQIKYLSKDELKEMNASQTLDRQNDEISRTWYKVIRIAGYYGAYPKNAF